MNARIYEYDSEAVRREARKLQRCCERLDEGALPRVRSIRAELDGSFEGRAAEALDERLARALAELQGLRGGCNGLCSALTRYADALEEADRRVAELLDG